MEAIRGIRSKNPGYFDRVDVRVVSGDPDEIRALNLKLNADRVDTKITDYFDTVVYLNNANWSKERIADFLDKSIGWIDDIIRFVPMITRPMHDKLKAGELSWNKAKEIISQTLKAPVGSEKETLEAALSKAHEHKFRPLTFRSAIGNISKVIKEKPQHHYTVKAEDLYALMVTLQGKNYTAKHLEHVRAAFPGLLEP